MMFTSVLHKIDCIRFMFKSTNKFAGSLIFILNLGDLFYVCVYTYVVKVENIAEWNSHTICTI